MFNSISPISLSAMPQFSKDGPTLKRVAGMSVVTTAKGADDVIKETQEQYPHLKVAEIVLPETKYPPGYPDVLKSKKVTVNFSV